MVEDLTGKETWRVFRIMSEFVEGFAWVHLDVAGTAYTDADTPPLAKGPAGVPMRTFVEWVLARAS